jgi:tetratricopeptide (TPR) repeat protein
MLLLMFNFASSLAAILLSTTPLPSLPNYSVVVAHNEELGAGVEAQETQAMRYVQQAQTLFDQGDIKGAVRYYTRAINLDSNYAYAYSSRASAFRSLRDFRRAEADYTQLIRLEPTYINFQHRGDMRYALKDYRGALADYDEALRTYSCCSLSGAYNDRGLARLALRDYQGALADFDLAITTPRSDGNYRDPYTFAEAYLNRAITRLRLKDKPGAIADLKRAVALTQADLNDEVYKQAMRKLKKLE